jgi:hypothetical protein
MPCVEPARRKANVPFDGANVPSHPGGRRVAVACPLCRDLGERPAATQRGAEPQMSDQFGHQSIVHPALMPSLPAAAPDDDQNADDQREFEENKDALLDMRFKDVPKKFLYRGIGPISDDLGSDQITVAIRRDDAGAYVIYEVGSMDDLRKDPVQQGQPLSGLCVAARRSMVHDMWSYFGNMAPIDAGGA